MTDGPWLGESIPEDTRLAEAFTLINRLLAEMNWMSGAPDFGPGGIAQRGWERGPKIAMRAAEKWLSENEAEFGE